MFNSKMLVVFKREVREKLLSKSFIIMTLLIPVFMFGILGIQTYLINYESSDKVKYLFLTPNDEIKDLLKIELDSLKAKDTRLTYDINTLEETKYDSIINGKKSEILSEKINGVFTITLKGLKEKNVNYYSKIPNNAKVFEKLRPCLNNVLISHYFKDKSLKQEDINFAVQRVSFDGFKVSENEKTAKEGYGNTILSFLFAFLLYFSLLMIGAQMMRSVIEEKTNRIVEVLLSSINARELITGKIFGTSLTGLIQMAIWISPVLLVGSTALFALPEEFQPTFSALQFIFFLSNYLIGLVSYLALFATIGAIFDNDQDAQQGMWPVMMLIMIPFFIAISLMNNPENSIAKIVSLIPIGSIIVMPARMAIADVPAYELVISLVGGIVVMILLFMLSAKIYKNGILFTGKKPKWSEIIKWIKS